MSTRAAANGGINIAAASGQEFNKNCLGANWENPKVVQF